MPNPFSVTRVRDFFIFAAASLTRVLSRRSVCGLAFMSTCLLMLCSIFWANHAQAATTLRIPGGGQILIDAKNLEGSFETGRRRLILSDGVRIVYNQQIITCQKAVVDEAAQTIQAEGNLVISSQQAYVEGDSATLNYVNNTGVIINGFVKSGQVIFEGRVVRKTGPDTYEAEVASYTACTTCPTAWTFTGTRIKAEVGGYAYIKNPILEVARFPVLWLPYLIVPLKSERQTGLLIPSFDFSGPGGAAVAGHFFWAISRSQDATFSLKNYTLRGLKGLVNHRYMLSETSQGELNAAFARDKIFQKDLSDSGGQTNPPKYRWFTTYQHSYDLPEDITNKINLNFASDLRYPRDFPDELRGLGDPALENRISFTRNSENIHASLDADYYINQLKSDPLADNRDSVHRWPELRYALTEQSVFGTDLLFNLNTNYVNFAREDFAFDDVTRPDPNGPKVVDVTRNQPGGAVFNPDLDVIRAGQRFDFLPEISYPVRLFKHLDVLPAVQFRHTQYSFNVTTQPGTAFDPTPYRQYVRGRVASRMRFFRVYGQDNAPQITEQTASLSNWTDAESTGEADITKKAPPAPRPNLYKHEFEPEIVYAAVPYLNTSDNSSAFFGDSIREPAFLDTQPVSSSDFQSTRGLQFDYEDRFIYRNTLSAGIGNRIVRKSWVNGTPAYRQIASFRIAQSYDFDEAKKNGATEPKFPWSDISALVDIRLDNFDTNTVVRYFPYHNKTNTSSRARVMDDRGRFLQVSFSQTYQITKNVEEAGRGRTDNVGFSAGLDTKYLGFAGTVDYLPESYWPVSFNVKSWSAQLAIKPPGECWGILLGLRQDIGGFLQHRLNFEYNFGGEAQSAPTFAPNVF